MTEAPELPIPISLISGRYYLFSIDAVTYLRREYNICGVLIGTLPQIPQQNVFLSLPLELMPEEARLLVEKRVAYIVDDAQHQKSGMKALLEEDRLRYLRDLEEQCRKLSLVQATKKEEKREKALQKLKNSKSKSKAESPLPEQNPEAQSSDAAGIEAQLKEADDDLLFGPTGRQPASDIVDSKSSGSSGAMISITPATSRGLLPNPSQTQILPDATPSYPLFTHLHSQGYFLSPGLRFGCQYMAYPGDSLRFHSHFLVTSADWDEEIALMDLVAGGRLGTGVKKGYLIGGADTSESVTEDMDVETLAKSVRTFSIEWAGM